MPMNMAMPPRRGVGRVWTSRSRMLGYSRYLRLSLRMMAEKVKVMSAATPAAST